MGSLFIWELAASSSTTSVSRNTGTVVIAKLPPLSSVRGGGVITESNSNGDNRARPSVGLVDADDIIDEMTLAARQQQPETDSSEQVFKSTHVYRPSSLSPTAMRRKRPRSKSRLGQEGDSLLRSLKTVTTRTTNGLARAVNVTGTAASVVAGGAFKLAGAAVLDAVDGIDYISAKSPREVPGITDTWRLVAKGLRKTGETVYDFGVAAENVTAEATEVAEETIRTVVGSVIDTASGSSSSSSSDRGAADGQSTRGYFSDEEERIIDNMMFGMSSADGETAMTAAAPGGAGGAGKIEFSEGDLSTQFGRDAARGHHHQGLLEAAAAGRGAANPAGVRQQQQQRGGRGRGRGQERGARKLAFMARLRLAIRHSIMRTSKAVPTMRFPQFVACGMVFACRAATANPWCGAASFVGARLYLKFVESIYLDCLKERMMSDIKFEAVARLHEGSPERARWFNTAVEAMWVPMLEPLLSGWTSRQITRGIERSLPSNVSWVGLGKVTLGPTPPKIRYVQVHNVTSLAVLKNMGTSNGVMDSVLLEAGQPGGDVVGENVVYLELGVDWTSSRSKVSLKLGEQSRRRNWWSLSSYVPTYRVKVCDLGIKAKVVAAFAVGEGRPFVKRLWVGFSEPPLTHLSLEALSGMDIANLPVLRNHLRHVVMRCLMPLTEPRYLNIEMKPPAPPPSSYRGAALAARVRPAMRRGVLSRVPAFGLRRLLGRGAPPRIAAAPAAAAAESEPESEPESAGGRTEGTGAYGRPGEWGGQGKELEEATRRLLVEVGGELRDETVMAAEVSRGDADVGVDGDGDGLVVEDVSSKAKASTMKKTITRDAKGGKEKNKRGNERVKGRTSSADKLTVADPSKVKKDAASKLATSSKNARAKKGLQQEEEEEPEEAQLSKSKDKVPAPLEEEDLDWRGNPRTRGKTKRQKGAAAVDPPASPSSEGEPPATPKEPTSGGKVPAEATTASSPTQPSRATCSSGSATTTIPPADTTRGPTTAASALAPTAATTAAAAGAGAAAVIRGPRTRTRREELRASREKVRRRRAARAALRERKKARGEPSPHPQPAARAGLPALVRAVREYWSGGRGWGRSRKASPEREGMIRSVRALSRPPSLPPQPPAVDGG
eukprot:g14076.t1